jgi:hypothetical protein
MKEFDDENEKEVYVVKEEKKKGLAARIEEKHKAAAVKKND